MVRRYLAIDSSTLVHSVALLEESELVCERVVRSQRGHSGVLLQSLHGCLEDAGWALQALDLLIVGAGPGSFVGLRIGLALAKGIALATGVDVTMGSSLAALAWGARASTGLLVPTLDARKNEVYSGLYRRSASSEQMTSVRSDRAIGPSALVELIVGARDAGEPVVLLGSGLSVFGDELVAELAPRVDELTLLDPLFGTPRASHLAAAVLAMDVTEVVPMPALEPNYQRLSEAEISLRERSSSL